MGIVHSVTSQSGVVAGQQGVTTRGLRYCSTFLILNMSKVSEQQPIQHQHNVNHPPATQALCGPHCHCCDTGNCTRTLPVALIKMADHPVSREPSTEVVTRSTTNIRRRVREFIEGARDHFSTMSGRYQISPADFDQLYQLYQEDTSAKGLYEFIVDRTYFIYLPSLLERPNMNF